MALSNYVYMAWDNEGNPCNGIIYGIIRPYVHCKIYKNWIYVRDKDMYVKDGTQFINDTIAEIKDGNIRLSEFNISAVRGPQYSIFTIISTSNRPTTKYMGGIGCQAYAYPFSPEEVLAEEGLDPAIYKFHSEFMEYANDNDSDIPSSFGFTFKKENGESIDIIRDYEKYGTKYCGVKESTLNEYLKWIENRKEAEVSIHYGDSLYKWVEKVKNSKK